MEAEAEILEPSELHYSDLLLLSSPSSGSSSPSPEEMERLESTANRVMEALGPSGPGLLCVSGVPRAPGLRRALLPLARKLALLGSSDRARILKRHGLGTDVSLKNPDRIVSSFAKQLKFMENQSLESISSLPEHECGNTYLLKENVKDVEDGHNDFEFNELGNTFKELGFCMMELGLCLAQLCDRKLGNRELELSILESCTAKGRLIHYHSILDNIILKETKKRTKGSIKKPATFNSSVPWGPTTFGIIPHSGMELHYKPKRTENLNGETNPVPVGCRTSWSELWQQWHYDYGILTILTAPMFLCLCDMSKSDADDLHCISSCQKCSPPDGHTCLQLFDNARNLILTVKTPPESFIVQVGESADVLSHGQLCSTLHSVCRPVGVDNLSRETFVVFLQPAWDKTFSVPGNIVTSKKQIEELTSSETINRAHSDKSESNSLLVTTKDCHNLKEEILKAVPPLYSRLRDGMTFAEFSRETTKQYYGGSGKQSRN